MANLQPALRLWLCLLAAMASPTAPHRRLHPLIRPSKPIQSRRHFRTALPAAQLFRASLSRVVPGGGAQLFPPHSSSVQLDGARRLFPKGSTLELAADLADEHYAYRARERLRRVALVPLRCALKLPEVFISARAWDSVAYMRVASMAMNYKELFLKHDADRFNAYLADVKSGKKRIAAGALLPHKIIASLGDQGGVADLQWHRMVDDMCALGKLRNCVVVCDVSGSMGGLPMDVCVALGLLVSELSDDPWRGRVIIFSPVWQVKDKKSLEMAYYFTCYIF